ncbi:unnamed protein product [Cylindrotheca closterium]|uniref:Uncharacterized protein n=1 Tax=Cylindrotheca closterium TaxID=2856 RepID=A0AAD2FXT5_9STRA|nr:unnamed protein product [Cylindrotheca closterium]
MNFCNPSNSDSSSAIGSSYRPMTLKQRTSSKDTRRDYTHNTWTSLLFLLKIRELFITVDNFSIWRRHMAWAMNNGEDLKAYMTQRYSSNMIFMSLLLSTELGVLFSTSSITASVRQELQDGQHFTLSFWAGLMIIISALLTILSLISIYTAWAMVNSINANNAHCILRSSIGQYAAELPGRLIVCSIYSFLISFVIYFFLLLPVGIWSILLLASTLFLFFHIVSVFSALGRVIMHTGAMGDERIFAPEFEELLIPHTLHSNLLAKSKANLENNTSIIRQYRRKQAPIDRFLTEEEIYDHLCGRLKAPLVEDFVTSNRPRVDSTVRFADEEQGRPEVPVVGYERSLSAISDVSSPSAPPRAFAVASKPPGQAQTTKRHPSSLNRPKYSSRPPSGPPVVPKPDNFDAHALRNVSSSSLEQWLQASPRGSSDGNYIVSFPEPEQQNDDVNATAANAHSPPPPPFHQTTPKDESPKVHSKSERKLSSTSSVSSTKSFQEMSDDERFDFEYGDIGDNKKNGSNHGDADNLGGEKTSLLGGHNRPYNDYGNSAK